MDSLKYLVKVKSNLIDKKYKQNIFLKCLQLFLNNQKQ